MADVIILDEEPNQEELNQEEPNQEEPNQEESTASVQSESEGTSEETPNGVKTDADETKPPNEKYDAKEKSSGSRRGSRFHPYKDKHAGEKKGGHRNRVFISNIPYDMKWQAIKDLMRDKGNVPSDGDDTFHRSIT